jgi:uncharacterized membrane protein
VTTAVAARPASPSSWSHRLPVIVLALVGCGVASYLTLYQLRLTSSVWDPLFGAASSEAVLTWARPVPDAGLGALAYVVEAIVTGLGGQERWRTSPRLVLLFGLVLAGLAITSLVLIVIQVLVVHALCSLCLTSAAISFVNAYLGYPEVQATLTARKP